MTAIKDFFQKIKNAFDGPVPPAAPDAQPADTTGATSAAYNVDGGGTVYVDISDDGIPDIDAGDKVYSDPALSVPYADGSYKVTGTDFGFTVAAGAVTDVQDADGAGPGAPVGDPNAMAAPVTTTTPPAAPTPTLEQRVKAVEEALAKMPRADQGMAAQFTAQEKTVAKHEQTIKDMFELINMLIKEPTAEPKTLNGNKKDQFEKSKKKDEKFRAILDSLQKTKDSKKY